MCDGCAEYVKGWLFNCQYYCTMPPDCVPNWLGFFILVNGIIAIIVIGIIYRYKSKLHLSREE